MTGFVFVIIFGLSSSLFSCEGKVFSPSAGTSLYFLRESTGKIVWSFDDIITTLSRRTWSFTSSDGKHRAFALAIIDGNGGVQKLTDLFEFAIEKPATLVLKNVNLTYEGTYQFAVLPSVGVGSSDVDVFITVTPIMVEVDSSSPYTINATENYTCVCKASGGRRPINVTWFKGKEQIRESRKGEQTLRLNNVGRDHNGTYRCEAKSHDTAINITEIELIVNYPPEDVKLTLTHIGSSATLKCSAEAQPTASFQIFLNEIMLIKSEKTYTIPEVSIGHVGNYTCVAENFLGSETSEYLSLKGPLATDPTTVSSEKMVRTTRSVNETDRAASKNTSCQTEWYTVVVTLLAGIIIGILFSYIFSCSRRKFRRKNPQSSSEPQITGVDQTYQELDLTKMNKEDNYQSLRVNAASYKVANDEDSNYAELSKARDVESNYQSLT